MVRRGDGVREFAAGDGGAIAAVNLLPSVLPSRCFELA